MNNYKSNVIVLVKSVYIKVCFIWRDILDCGTFSLTLMLLSLPLSCSGLDNQDTAAIVAAIVFGFFFPLFFPSLFL